MNILESFAVLDFHLTKYVLKREIVIAGGSALIALNITDRATQDIDILIPQIDSELNQVAISISEKEGYPKGWLNNGVNHYIDRLRSGWENRVQLVYEGKSLKVFSLSRIDILGMKISAQLDREADMEDLLLIKPSKEELDLVCEWLKVNPPHMQFDKAYHSEVDSLKLKIQERIGI